jgi:dihydropteroate synthase
MHSRGGPDGFHQPEHKAYDSLEADIASELTQAADAAMKAGIPAWCMMLDTGIGFSKCAEDSMKLVTSSSRIRQHLPGTVRSWLSNSAFCTQWLNAIVARALS